MGTWERVAGDPQGDARQNDDSAQGFHRVCAAQQAGGCRDSESGGSAGSEGLTASPRRGQCHWARPHSPTAARKLV